MADEIHLEGVHCSLTIRRPTDGVVLAVYRGADIGEFGERPFEEVERALARGLPIELFIDARDVPAVSIEVSGAWASWMIRHRGHLQRVSILCASRFTELTASFVRRFTRFGDRMRIYDDEAAFEQALEGACGTGGARPRP